MACHDHVDVAQRPVYSPEQLQRYYDRILLPKSYRDHPVTRSSDAAKTNDGLFFLTALQRHQVAAVPFENLELHYSSHHTVNLDPQHLFHKIVERGTGRGGYCMENSCLFGIVLRSLGYDVFSTGARVNEAAQPIAATKGWKGPRYDGWNHMINIVTIMNQRYIVDVGFSSSGPMHPLRLISDEISINVGQQSMKLTKTNIPDNTNPDQQLWCYQHRHSHHLPWIPSYCFTETEFLPNDFVVMNHFTSTSRTSWFTYMVICVKMLVDGDVVVGDITLFNNQVKKRIRGESELLAVLTSEEERVAALAEHLGVRLSEAEKAGIHGMITELM
ncbi:arylamine n-acetyltransferase 1 [Lasallia pustulata]|uniref:Tpa: arylamine n-acetyltransferase 1 n=1 Tax=Lasallia pustulata TaxID=136370 RepID=A0A1W5DBI2_9LECA|nr:arylamine n-acetyltransferase 1 [Lasallia pustulata]